MTTTKTIGTTYNSSSSSINGLSKLTVPGARDIDNETLQPRLDPAVNPFDSPVLYSLDCAEPLDPSAFPNPPRPGRAPVTTIPNVNHLLASYRITVRYDVIKKKLVVTMPGQSGSPDNSDNVALTQIISLATLNGMSTGPLPSMVEVIGDRNLYNPAADWILSKPWDGADRLPLFYATLVQREDFPESLKQTLMYRWMLSAVAAVLKPKGFRCRGVLTLQGPQGIGKTAWSKSLVSDPALSHDLIKLDHHLDAGNKDSLLNAISHWIVEIGELDSSLKKDVARLKGFLTADQDKVRRPYGRVDSEYSRKTVFCATVNDENFLVDSTGNTRWWTLPVVSIDFEHGIDMQQVFAQLVEDYRSDEQWWLTAEEERELETYNKPHRSVSALRERILDAIELERAKEPKIKPLTPIELLKAIGIDNPSNGQCKECGGILRELFGDPDRINGRDKWRVPLITDSLSFFSKTNSNDDHLY